jgi:hypothetical protein
MANYPAADILIGVGATPQLANAFGDQATAPNVSSLCYLGLPAQQAGLLAETLYAARPYEDDLVALGMDAPLAMQLGQHR